MLLRRFPTIPRRTVATAARAANHGREARDDRRPAADLRRMVCVPIVLLVAASRRAENLIYLMFPIVGGIPAALSGG
jgi:hypothetical protein